MLGPPDSDPVPVDKAAGRPASASSTQSSPALDPGRATDEDSATRWSSASLDGQWWQVDLGSLRTVDTVELNWETAYASSYRLETSRDGAHFAPAATENISSPGLRRTTFAARAARFVRIRALTRATAFGISLWDARVYGGSDPGPDGTPPDTTMDSGPSGPTNAASPTFGFSANEPGSWFECRIDGGGWGECSAPHTAGPLADGGHSFDVRATDPAGNPTPPPPLAASPSTRPRRIRGSTTARPVPRPMPRPRSTSQRTSPRPSSAGSTAMAGVCPARYTTAPLPDGAHTLDVRATDPAGNVDPTPASRSWTITPTARSYTDVIIGTRGLLGLWPLGDTGSRAADLAKGHRGRYSGGPARDRGADPGRAGRRAPVRRRERPPPRARRRDREAGLHDRGALGATCTRRRQEARNRADRLARPPARRAHALPRRPPPAGVRGGREARPPGDGHRSGTEGRPHLPARGLLRRQEARDLRERRAARDAFLPRRHRLRGRPVHPGRRPREGPLGRGLQRPTPGVRCCDAEPRRASTLPHDLGSVVRSGSVRRVADRPLRRRQAAGFARFTTPSGMSTGPTFAPSERVHRGPEGDVLTAVGRPLHVGASRYRGPRHEGGRNAALFTCTQ